MIRFFKMSSLTLLLATALLMPVASAQAAGPVAVVDSAALATQSTPGKAAADYLTKVQASLQKSMDELLAMYKGKEDTDEGRAAILQGKAALDQQLVLYRQNVAMQLDEAMSQAVKTWRAANKKTVLVVSDRVAMDYAADIDITREVMPHLNKMTLRFPDMPQVTINKPEKK